MPKITTYQHTKKKNPPKDYKEGKKPQGTNKIKETLAKAQQIQENT
jgi:hypothetical protein